MVTASPQSGTIAIAADEDVSGGQLAAIYKNTPAVARAKRDRLRREWAKFLGVSSSLHDLKMKEAERRSELKFELEHMQRDLARGYVSFSAADHARMTELQSAIDGCTAAMAAYDADSAKLASPYDPGKLDSFMLAAGRGVRWKTCIPSVTLRKNQTAVAAHKELGREIVALADEADAARNAPLPFAAALENVTAQIDHHAKRGSPFFARARLVQEKSGGRFVAGSVQFPTKWDDKGTEYIDAAALTIFLNRDALVASAKSELERIYADAGADNAMTIAERKERLAAIAEETLALERREEVARLQAEQESGQPVAIRPDASPLAILQIEANTAPMPRPAPEPDEPAETEAERKRSLRRMRLRDAAVPSEPKTDGADPDDFG